MTKTAIITGASRGIGKAIAEEFAARDYRLALLSRHYGEVDLVAQELLRKEPRYENRTKCLPFECDIQNPINVQDTFRQVWLELGSIDVLVNNAGVNMRKSFPAVSPTAPDAAKASQLWNQSFEDNLAGWKEEIAVNLTGSYICSYLAAGYMLSNNSKHTGPSDHSIHSNPSGSIINISSIKGKEPTTGAGYGASKAGMIKLTRDFAKVLAPQGIRVNCLALGFIDTGMTAELPEEKKKQYRSQIPLQRFGRVEEVAKVVAFLASEDSSYITGATIDVNGGYLML